MKNTKKILTILMLSILLLSMTMMTVSASRPSLIVGTVKNVEKESNFHGTATPVNLFVVRSMKLVRSGSISYWGRIVISPLGPTNSFIIASTWVN